MALGSRKTRKALLILPLVEAHHSQANLDFSDGSGFAHGAPVLDATRPVSIKSQKRKIVPLFMVEPHGQARGAFQHARGAKSRARTPAKASVEGSKRAARPTKLRGISEGSLRHY